MKRRGKGFWKEGKERKDKILCVRKIKKIKEEKKRGFQFDRSKEGEGVFVDERRKKN